MGSLIVSSANGLSKRRGDFGNETIVLRLADFRNSERVYGNERNIKLDELDTTQIVPNFVLFVAKSGSGRSYVESVLVTSAGQNTINQASLSGLDICLPSICEQTEIVRRVESLFAYADRLEARYTAARVQVEKLTPALLAKAFRGELVPQDPSDEPAGELLARIAAARETAATV